MIAILRMEVILNPLKTARWAGNVMLGRRAGPDGGVRSKALKANGSEVGIESIGDRPGEPVSAPPVWNPHDGRAHPPPAGQESPRRARPSLRP